MNLNRVKSIDALRGFALLGILIVNMFSFQYAAEHISVISSYPRFSEFMYYAVRILLQGSFLTMFAFLFGFSIMQFYYSRERKQLAYKIPLFRRGLALFIIGLLHYIFVWYGDILASYGFMMIVVLFFVTTTEKVLKILMYVLFPLYFLLNVTSRLSSEQASIAQSSQLDNTVYVTASYSEALDHRLMFGLGEIFFSPIVNFILHLINITTVPMLLVPFAIYGMYVSKRQLTNVKKFEAVSIKVWLPITIIGIALKCGLLLGGFLGFTMLTLGSILTTYGYIHLFLTLYDKALPEKIKLCFEYVGKMTISNYLAQSIIMTILFANFGFGLAGKLGITWGVVIALAFFVLQALCSYMIINRFKQGPVEYLLRKFIYMGDKKTAKRQSKSISA